MSEAALLERMRATYLSTTDVLRGHKARWLQQQIRKAHGPSDLRSLRGALVAELAGIDRSAAALYGRDISP